MFSDVLLTVDFDRTLTGPDSKIPERNLEAIRFFTANGGKFTLNTGRSTNTMGALLDTIPVNAPFLLYNGSAAYDPVTKSLQQVKTIDLDIWKTMEEVHAAFPEMNLEIQGDRIHYFYHAEESFVHFYEACGWNYGKAEPGMDVGPFIKFSLFGKTRNDQMGQYFSGTEEEMARMEELDSWIKEKYGDKVDAFRAAPRILDVHTKGVSKLRGARELQQTLGRKILVCVGDAENDLTMLRGADYAFCPADGVIAAEFPNVCPCGEGAVAEVIYEKIPEILKISLDK